MDPQKSLILLFKFCGSTIFGIKILWIHKILKLHLWIHKILKINVFPKKKIEENRGELSQFFFLMFEKMLKFSIEFDDFSNGASIAKPNTVPMFFVFFDFQVNLFFDFFL